MIDTSSPLHSSSTHTTDAPRARRGDAGVIAQYIQDLTHSAQPELRAAAA